MKRSQFYRIITSCYCIKRNNYVRHEGSGIKNVLQAKIHMSSILARIPLNRLALPVNAQLMDICENCITRCPQYAVVTNSQYISTARNSSKCNIIMDALLPAVKC